MLKNSLVSSKPECWRRLANAASKALIDAAKTFRNHIRLQSQAFVSAMRNNGEYAPIAIETR